MRIRALAPDEAVIDAAGRRVRVPTPEGRCLAEDMARVGPDSAVLVVTGCERPFGPVTGVTVGPEPLFGGAPETQGFAALEVWARSAAGRREMGMHRDPDRVRVLETRREDGALFALVEEQGPEPPAIRFWRVFSELNGRVAMLSVYDMAGDGHSDEFLHDVAALQLATLRAANPNADPPSLGPVTVGTPAIPPEEAITPPPVAGRGGRTPPPARP